MKNYKRNKVNESECLKFTRNEPKLEWEIAIKTKQDQSFGNKSEYEW